MAQVWLVCVWMAVATSEAQSYGAPSYGAPSYNAPSYNAPSYNAPSYNPPSYNSPSYNSPSYNTPSSDYGIPSGPVLSPQPSGAARPASGSGYTAPCSTYGCSSGAAAPAYQPSNAPVYVYQQAADPGKDNGLGGLGALKPFLLPLGGLALLAPLAFLAITTLFPATTIINPGRRRRAANMTLAGGEEEVLASYMAGLGPAAGGAGLQRDMVARYLGCGGRGEAACLQLLACVHADSSVAMDDTEREVAGIVLRSVDGNEFLDEGLRRRIGEAVRRGRQHPGSCHKYSCRHHLLPGPALGNTLV